MNENVSRYGGINDYSENDNSNCWSFVYFSRSFDPTKFNLVCWRWISISFNRCSYAINF